MSKESLSVSMAKLIMIVSLIVGIGAIFGMLGYFGTMPKGEVINEEKIEISNWQKYEYELWGFSLKIPSEYVKSEKNIEGNDLKMHLTIYSKDNTRIIISIKSLEDELSKQAIKEAYEDYQNKQNDESEKDIQFMNELNIDESEIIGVDAISEGGCVGLQVVSLENDKYSKDIQLVSLNNEDTNISLSFEYNDDQNVEIGKIIKTIQCNSVQEDITLKTYRNEEYGFEFEYPKDWTTEEIVKSSSLTKIIINPSEINHSKPIIDGVVIHINEEDENSSIKDYLNKDILVDPYSQPQKFKKFIELFPNYETVLIDNKDGIQYENKIAAIATPTQKIITTVLPINKNIIEIITDEEYINIYNQILSTFKFIEKDDTADWQTYRNEEYGFELKYPENWTVNKEEMTNFGLGGLREDADVYKTVFDTQIDYDENFGMGNFYIKVIDNPNRLLLSEWFEKNDIPKFGTKDAILSSIDDQKIVIDDVESIDRIISAGGGNERSIIIPMDDRIVVLNIGSSHSHPNYRDGSYAKNEYVNGYKRIDEFNQILSTFKFIEK